MKRDKRLYDVVHANTSSNTASYVKKNTTEPKVFSVAGKVGNVTIEPTDIDGVSVEELTVTLGDGTTATRTFLVCT